MHVQQKEGVLICKENVLFSVHYGNRLIFRSKTLIAGVLLPNHKH